MQLHHTLGVPRRPDFRRRFRWHFLKPLLESLQMPVAGKHVILQTVTQVPIATVDNGSKTADMQLKLAAYCKHSEHTGAPGAARWAPSASAGLRRAVAGSCCACACPLSRG